MWLVETTPAGIDGGYETVVIALIMDSSSEGGNLERLRKFSVRLLDGLTTDEFQLVVRRVAAGARKKLYVEVSAFSRKPFYNIRMGV